MADGRPSTSGTPGRAAARPPPTPRPSTTATKPKVTVYNTMPVKRGPPSPAVSAAKKQRLSDVSPQREVSKDDSIHVYVRPTKLKYPHSLSFVAAGNTITVSNDTKNNAPQVHKFTTVWNEDCTQEEVFNDAGRSIVDASLDGFNGCIFAYGQTGSGKTYTMQGVLDDESKHGLFPRALEHMFTRLAALQRDGWMFSCQFSAVEIYNEVAFDMLQQDCQNKNRVKAVRERPDKTFFVEDLTKVEISETKEALGFLMLATRQRITGATLMNHQSSRSHAIYTVWLSGQLETPEGAVVRQSHVNFIDLAGSERQSATGAEGMRQTEGIGINSSLLVLRKVISALTAPGKERPAFRESLLTSLLKGALEGNSRTAVIATVNPDLKHASETGSTLRFAADLKMVKVQAKANQSTQQDAAKQWATLQRYARVLSQHVTGMSTEARETLAQLLQTLGVEPVEDSRVARTLEFSESRSVESLPADVHRRLETLQSMQALLLSKEQQSDDEIQRLKQEVVQLREALNRCVTDLKLKTTLMSWYQRKLDKQPEATSAEDKLLSPSSTMMLESATFSKQSLEVTATTSLRQPDATTNRMSFDKAAPAVLSVQPDASDAVEPPNWEQLYEHLRAAHLITLQDNETQRSLLQRQGAELRALRHNADVGGRLAASERKASEQQVLIDRLNQQNEELRMRLTHAEKETTQLRLAYAASCDARATSSVDASIGLQRLAAMEMQLWHKMHHTSAAQRDANVQTESAAATGCMSTQTVDAEVSLPAPVVRNLSLCSTTSTGSFGENMAPLLSPRQVSATYVQTMCSPQGVRAPPPVRLPSPAPSSTFRLTFAEVSQSLGR